MEYAKTHISRMRPAGRITSQALMEESFDIPAEKILSVRGTAVPEQIQPSESRLQVQGSIRLCIIYIPEGESMPAAADEVRFFTHMLDFPGLTPEAEVFIDADMRQFEYEISGGKTNVSAVAELVCMAYDSSDSEYILPDSLPDGVEVLMENISGNTVTHICEGSVSLSEQAAVPGQYPAAQEALYCAAYPTVSEVRVQQGGVIAEGTVSVYTLYRTDDESLPVQTVKHEFPFEEEILCDEADFGSTADVIACGASASAAVDTEDGRIMDIDVSFVLRAMIYSPADISLVTDAYMPGRALTLTYDTLSLPAAPVFADERFSLRETLYTDGPQAAAPLDVFCRPYVVGIRTEGGSAEIEGVAECEALYRAEGDGGICSVRQSVPFSFTMPVPEGAECTAAAVYAEPGLLSLQGPAELDARLSVCIKLCCTGSLGMRHAAEMDDEGPAAEHGAAITVHYMRPDEDIWSVAKSFLVPRKDILRLNPSLEGGAAAGTPVIIYKGSAG